jgi:hypothetical protein
VSGVSQGHFIIPEGLLAAVPFGVGSAVRTIDTSLWDFECPFSGPACGALSAVVPDREVPAPPREPARTKVESRFFAVA